MSEDDFANNVNNNDPLEIGELAVLNEDISADFIEQLQGKIVSDLNKESDADLFEEVSDTSEQTEITSENANVSSSNEDDFAKRYKERLKNANISSANADGTNIVKNDVSDNGELDTEQTPTEIPQSNFAEDNFDESLNVEKQIAEKEIKDNVELDNIQSKSEIENLTSGNIKERPANQAQIDYNNSLKELDNKNYKKYIIYIEPENVEFIDSLSLKERKNLFNKIIKEQDCISSTKSKCYIAQTIIKHIIIAIFTLSISIPILYYTLNASLETSINNYKKSQSLFSSLYKAKGKIQNKANIK